MGQVRVHQNQPKSKMTLDTKHKTTQKTAITAILQTKGAGQYKVKADFMAYF